MTDFFTVAGVPGDHADGDSETIRNEFIAIQTGFGKLANYTSNNSKIIAVNSAGTAYEAIASVSVAQGGTGVTSTAQVAALNVSLHGGLTTTQLTTLTTAQVSALGTADVVSLNVSHHGGLTTSQIAVLGTSSVQALNVSHFGNLTTAQVAVLGTASVQALNVSHVGSLTTAQLTTLTTAQVSALGTADVVSLNVSRFGNLTTSQVALLGTASVQALNVSHVGSLTTAQLTTLTTAQVSALGTANVVSLNVSHFGNLTTSQVAVLASANTFTSTMLNTGQPAFLALAGNQLNVTGDATLYTVTFANAEIFDQANNFDGTSTFTAPLTGKYRFDVIVRVDGVTAGATVSYLEIVTSNRTYVPFYRAAASGNLGSEFTMSGSALCDMDAADTCVVKVKVSGLGAVVDISGTVTSFAGNLVC